MRRLYHCSLLVLLLGEPCVVAASAQRSVPLGMSSAHALRTDHYAKNNGRRSMSPFIQSNDEIPKGAVGAIVGGAVGATVGYLAAVGLCERQGGCSGAKAAVGGAIIGAIVGFGLEWLIRPWQ
jgi:outer membrane lipoprotein SlyB